MLAHESTMDIRISCVSIPMNQPWAWAHTHNACDMHFETMAGKKLDYTSGCEEAEDKLQRICASASKDTRRIDHDTLQRIKILKRFGEDDREC